MPMTPFDPAQPVGMSRMPMRQSMPAPTTPPGGGFSGMTPGTVTAAPAGNMPSGGQSQQIDPGQNAANVAQAGSASNVPAGMAANVNSLPEALGGLGGGPTNPSYYGR